MGVIVAVLLIDEKKTNRDTECHFNFEKSFMKNIADNHMIRFISISKKKEGMFANFRVKGIKGGAQFSASISVDLSATELTAQDPLEQLIEESAKIAVKEFKKSEMQFEGIQSV